MAKKIAVIMPAWNEEKHISEVIKRIKHVSLKNKLDLEIIVIDDGSADNTSKIAKESKADVVLRHIINLGKGNAARTGCDFAYKEKYNIFILMDSDGQHEPEDIPRFLEALKNTDIVYGYRTSEGKSPFLMSVGNWGLTWLVRIMFGAKIRDTQSGFRTFRRNVYKQLRWESKLYGMETEMIVNAKGLKYKEIPIKTIYLDNYKGTTPIHGIKILIQMIKWKAIQLLGGK
ncbi:glycosyltransferase family 2 protein [Candidatus Woesearchaeota archaeon]|nr:glycosyltransferase family 2 protein [Candidatus Woesearchaeota archaeon]